MKIYVMGICGTFMAGIASLAKSLGHEVVGSDQNVYPPMSDLLQAQGITLRSPYAAANLDDKPDLVVIGNAISRGHVEVERVLNENIPFYSGPEILYRALLKDRHVIAIAGTHGKTTTSSLVAWILEYAGLEPGFLIGGIPNNFSCSARLGKSPYFVIEADEYDTAFFDKRSKFLHYHPTTAILNNLEFDHADIFPDLEAIKKQFSYLLRTVPQKGCVLFNNSDANLQEVITRGVWSPTQKILGEQSDWNVKALNESSSHFAIFKKEAKIAEIQWNLIGSHNMHNALFAFAAAHQIGIPVKKIQEACEQFKGVRRRMDIRGVENNITVIDDFAHHPTAVKLSLSALRKQIGENKRLIGVLEFRSNTMAGGYHQEHFANVFDDANQMYFVKPKKEWSLDSIINSNRCPCTVFETVPDAVNHLSQLLKPGDFVLGMSNGSFDQFHQRLLNRIAQHKTET